ncbi:MAG: ATP-binding protein [Terriglobales bacterium]
MANKATQVAVAETTKEPLVQVDTALMSLRSSNFDTPAAVGEPVDNALQAGANNIKIRLIEGERKVGKKQKAVPVVEQIAFSDDGSGMDHDVVKKALVLGFSTRYNSRQGMGRFGVGATLAGISQAKRLEIFSRNVAGGEFLYSYIDLDEITNGDLKYMPDPHQAKIPQQFADMAPVGTGTLVVWSKCDRLTQGEDGTVNDLKSVRDELLNWLSRTYRHFIDGGVRIQLNDTVVEPHDPLYLMTIPRLATDEKAEVLLDESFDWDIPSDPSRHSTVKIKMTLLPAAWRLKRGWGHPDRTQTRERRIHDNEGISILRARREIFYDILPRFYPSAVEEADRWFGIELSFDPELDECFRVKNVKKGAEPVEGLRDTLKKRLDAAIRTARRRIKETYVEQDNKEKAEQQIHEAAENIGAEAEKTAPKARSGAGVSETEREAKLDEVAKEAADAAADEGTAAPPASAADIKERLKQLPFSIVDMQWPGKEFIQIEHLGTNTVVKLNNKHPFFTRIYAPVLKASGAMDGKKQEGQETLPTAEEFQQMARLLHVGLDLLILAYAKAESMETDPEEKYGDLRSHWGMFLYNVIQKMPAA